MKRLWISFVAVMIVSFLVLGWIGTRIYNLNKEQQAQLIARLTSLLHTNTYDAASDGD